MDYTLVIIVITCVISIAALSNENLMNKLILWPRRMDNPSEYYRLLTSGFIHADWMHLFFNMFTLYAFGQLVQTIFAMHSIPMGMYLLLYLSAIITASLPSYLKNRNNSYYRSLGASGGVAAILFFTIYYLPWWGIRIMFIPFDIPGIVFGVLYIAYEAYMAKKGVTRINHDAHLWGSIYGFLFAFIVDPFHGSHLIETLSHPRF